MILKKVENFLSEEGLNAVLVPASEEVPYERILLFLGVDSKGRERFLEMTAQEQILSQSLPGHHIDRKSYHRVQFKSTLPFTIDDLALSQVGSLLHFLNGRLDFPGFELNELDNQVSFRYILLTHEEGLDFTLLSTLIGMFTLFIESFAPCIERLAEGNMTFNDLLQEIIQLGERIKSEL